MEQHSMSSLMDMARQTVAEGKLAADCRPSLTTHSLAEMLLDYPDVPLMDCRYEGDLEGDYEMMLSDVVGIDYGIVPGIAVVCTGEREIGYEELVDSRANF